jgi:hypothetical protein
LNFKPNSEDSTKESPESKIDEFQFEKYKGYRLTQSRHKVAHRQSKMLIWLLAAAKG